MESICFHPPRLACTDVSQNFAPSFAQKEGTVFNLSHRCHLSSIRRERIQRNYEYGAKLRGRRSEGALCRAFVQGRVVVILVDQALVFFRLL